MKHKYFFLIIILLTINFRALSSTGKDIKDPFLKELAVREDANRSGKMTVRMNIKDYYV